MYKIPRNKLLILKIITAVIIFFATICSCIAGFFAIYIRTPVEGLSMLPTLNSVYESGGDSDIVYINRFSKGRVGDIVVLDLRNHSAFGGYSIKRLIAVEGDVVNIQHDDENNREILLVNGVIVDSRPSKIFKYNTVSCFEQYVANHKDDYSRISRDKDNNINGIIIKKGEIYVLGDNWDKSKDSSFAGPLSIKRLVGRVDIVVSPNQNEFLTILKRIF